MFRPPVGSCVFRSGFGSVRVQSRSLVGAVLSLAVCSFAVWSWLCSVEEVRRRGVAPSPSAARLIAVRASSRIYNGGSDGRGSVALSSDGTRMSGTTGATSFIYGNDFLSCRNVSRRDFVIPLLIRHFPRSDDNFLYPVTQGKQRARSYF